MANRSSVESFQAFIVSAVPVHRIRFINVAYALGALYVILKAVQVTRRRLKTTALRGPPNPSFVWGTEKALFSSPDPGVVYEKWAEEYGAVYQVPSALLERKIVLCDPKAVVHLFAGEPWTYTLTPSLKIITENLMGKSTIFTATGESHRRLGGRQRKALTPAFSNAAIRNLASAFYDSGYKVKGIWDSLIESGGGSALIDVQNWMNHLSLDTIGIAGFSHDFGSLDGRPTPVTEIFDTLSNNSGDLSLEILLSMFAQTFPSLLRLPTPYSKLLVRFNDIMGEIANALLAKSKKEKDAGTLGEKEEKSVLGLLIEAENQGGRHYLTREEVVGHAKVLLLAGYESTSITLTWALIELSKNPDVQTKLREELLEFGADPTFDQLPNNLQYLDAVVHETFRTHPPVSHFARMSAVDDVIPLSKPIHDRSGKLVDHISVAKGTHLFVSVPSIHRSTALWGADAKEFKPERWIRDDGIPDGAKELQGHRHLLTFIDGPRICLGKTFAITEFKIMLSILLRNFVFELRDGPETRIEKVLGILPRPKVAGEQGTAVPLRVRRFE